MTVENWQEAFEGIAPLVVKISTPSGSGTGFLVSHSSVDPICGIATAAHVVDHAHYWEQPIKIDYSGGGSILLRQNERAVLLDDARDTAAIVFAKGDFPIPTTPPQLAPEKAWLRVGIEVGWVGYPAVSPRQLCFFSGRVSAVLESEYAYLIDGVSINGVSGGPTIYIGKKGLVVIGVVSAYVPNRATGEVLPGLSIVQDVSQFQSLVKQFKSIDQAKLAETEQAEPPPPNPEDGN